jgi:hypothetical protein
MINGQTTQERLAIWLNCYKHFSPACLLIRLQELREEKVGNAEDNELKALAIRSILQFNGLSAQ